ncbi:MAG: response regulator [Candidatus Eisenbacteria bacterium]|uniref:Response regulator n=1 Tax=Eiseniibacteriota bacterium TaxID=2212470 RepID=A0A538U5A6_UNCEI|nr:MAG: response regulator [Candidatus Eisenbacteria bacterium]
MIKSKILIAEDEMNLREVLRFQLTTAGYDVVEAEDGRQAIEKARETMPDLLLLDVMMPYVDGFEVVRELRKSFLTRHIPIIMLTAKAELEDRLHGFDDGANDYIVKPWDYRELKARVRNALAWSQQQRAASPLTGLPGNLSIEEELRHRLEAQVPFALLMIDIDYFKSFNDHYGYARGDDAIRAVARILVDQAQRHGGSEDFVGHIGGDDFVILTRPEVDRARGFVEVANRRHVIERFPLMSLTIALVNTERIPVTHRAELGDIAQELKSHGKGIPGSVVVGERRARESDDPDARQDVA